MALWFKLMCNAESKGTLEAQRIPGPFSGTQDDPVYRYNVRLDGRFVGTVDHRYADGAWVLAWKALVLLMAFQASRERHPSGQLPRLPGVRLPLTALEDYLSAVEE